MENTQVSSRAFYVCLLIKQNKKLLNIKSKHKENSLPFPE